MVVFFAPKGAVVVAVEVEDEDDEDEASELGANTPPCPTVGGKLLVPLKAVAPAAKAARVFPVAGALMEPTIPALQWFPGIV